MYYIHKRDLRYSGNERLYWNRKRKIWQTYISPDNPPYKRIYQAEKVMSRLNDEGQVTFNKLTPKGVEVYDDPVISLRGE